MNLFDWWNSGNTPVRTLPLSIPVAGTAGAAGRSPDSSSVDGVTSSCLDSDNNQTATVTMATELVACGEATPPQANPQIRAAGHPSPVVQSSQIDSCVHEEGDNPATAPTSAHQAAELWTDKAGKRPPEFNNNIHWLKASNTPAVAAAVLPDGQYQLNPQLNPVNWTRFDERNL